MKYFLSAFVFFSAILILTCCGDGSGIKLSGASDPRSDTTGIYVLKRDSVTSLFAYYNKSGEKVLGDYIAAYSDTMKDFAIVADPGFVLIDRWGRHLYDIFVFDNGPDYTSEGLYRVVINNKIGFVDSVTSELVIPAIYQCAYPFENGRARVSTQCITKSDGEHSSWESESWFYIDKNGKKLNN